MATKTKTPAKPETAAIVYTDKDGKEVKLSPRAIKAYEDTQYFADTDGLFPQIAGREATLNPDAGTFDPEGRPNLLGVPLIIVDVVQMTKGPYGPWFLMHVIAGGDEGFNGEFTLPTRGGVVAETIEALSGISLETGKRIAPGELPVSLVIDFAVGGEFDGYYYTRPVAEAAEAVEVS